MIPLKELKSTHIERQTN